MKRFLLGVVVLAGILCGARGQSDRVQVIKGPDERFKVDILVVVAHPDDEGGVTPYLARAIYDEHKRVAVVYTTRGGSGGNDYAREHGPALADIREQEARQACAKLGITNVWFLDGKDTASQNVLNSLANWGHGANLDGAVLNLWNFLFEQAADEVGMAARQHDANPVAAAAHFHDHRLDAVLHLE